VVLKRAFSQNDCEGNVMCVR